jgi:hypothetical protein
MSDCLQIYTEQECRFLAQEQQCMPLPAEQPCCAKRAVLLLTSFNCIEIGGSDLWKASVMVTTTHNTDITVAKKVRTVLALVQTVCMLLLFGWQF